MDWGAVLLPPQPVQATSIPAAKLRENVVLEEAVITWSIQSPISEDFQTKGSIAVHAAEDHYLPVKSWSFHSKMVWPTSVLRISCLQGRIAANILRIHMAIS